MCPHICYQKEFEILNYALLLAIVLIDLNIAIGSLFRNRLENVHCF